MKNAQLRTTAVALIGIGAAVAIIWGRTALTNSESAPPRPVTFRTQTMGTWASLTIVTGDSAAVSDLAYRSLLALHRVDSLMSNWTDVSEVARINRAATKETRVQPEVARVLRFAQDVARASDGAFDISIEPLVRLWGFIGGPPRVPTQAEITATLERVGYDKLDFNAETRAIRFHNDGMRIDLGGIAKGYGVDQVADLLRAANASNALIDLSGNMVALGNAAGRKGWTVGLRDPRGKHPFLARIRLLDEAVATSGDYEQFVAADGRRYGHILDPRTGWSARGLSSVTIVARRAMVADAWATALFVLGPEAARRVASERDDFSAVLVEPRDEGGDVIWVEKDLRTRFEPADELAGKLTIRYF